ncbi:hypothetical protein BKA63DRAFT_558878 [Paraphoma chrysanthemicola]|nr:hypothetical protein BKA63DRAFT_558878 [Paraphoma chrysanthemicola]
MWDASTSSYGPSRKTMLQSGHGDRPPGHCPSSLTISCPYNPHQPTLIHADPHRLTPVNPRQRLSTAVKRELPSFTYTLPDQHQPTPVEKSNSLHSFQDVQRLLSEVRAPPNPDQAEEAHDRLTPWLERLPELSRDGIWETRPQKLACGALVLSSPPDIGSTTDDGRHQLLSSLVIPDCDLTKCIALHLNRPWACAWTAQSESRALTVTTDRRRLCHQRRRDTVES